MRGSRLGRLSVALVAGLFAVASAGADADAGGKNQGKKKGKAKAPASVGAKLSSAQLGGLMGPYKWGMSKKDILGVLSRQIGTRYKEKIAATTDVYQQDKLRRDRQVHRDHVGDFRITTDGLAITEQENRCSVWRNLHRAGRDSFGQQIARIETVQPRSIEADTHAIGILGHGKSCAE